MAKKGNKEKVAQLIKNGADVHSKDKDGKNPLDLAKNDEMKKLLRKAEGKSGKK